MAIQKTFLGNLWKSTKSDYLIFIQKVSLEFLLDRDAYKWEPSAGRRSSSQQVLQGDGFDLWEMYEAKWHEWSIGNENALHQLHLSEMY